MLFELHFRLTPLLLVYCLEQPLKFHSLTEASDENLLFRLFLTAKILKKVTVILKRTKKKQGNICSHKLSLALLLFPNTPMFWIYLISISLQQKQLSPVFGLTPINLHLHPSSAHILYELPRFLLSRKFLSLKHKPQSLWLKL